MSKAASGDTQLMRDRWRPIRKGKGRLAFEAQVRPWVGGPRYRRPPLRIRRQPLATFLRAICAWDHVMYADGVTPHTSLRGSRLGA